jgi:hypothetical protein
MALFTLLGIVRSRAEIRRRLIWAGSRDFAIVATPGWTRAGLSQMALLLTEARGLVNAFIRCGKRLRRS